MASMQRLLALALLALPVTLSAQEFERRLSINGYLTQAYGVSQRHLMMGLTDEGTTDYRRAAMLARYDVSPRDHFVVQLAHRRLGDSPTMQFEEPLKVDLAFYGHRFSNGTTARVGKVSLPWGIYNEVRYAGTLTPFYRAPYVVYRDGTYASETVDGASLSHVLRAGEPWELSLDLFGGALEQLEFGPTFPANSAPVYKGAVLEGRNVLGGQAWVATPVTGLRVGVGGRRQTDTDGIFERPAGGANTTTWTGSVDGQFDGWMVRAEHQQIRTFGFATTAHYAQGGVRVNPWLSVNVQTERRDEDLRYVPGGPWVSVQAARDNALGFNFNLAPNTVLKLEGHAAKGFGAMFEQIVDDRAPALTSRYFISSVSVSF